MNNALIVVFHVAQQCVEELLVRDGATVVGVHGVERHDLRVLRNAQRRGQQRVLAKVDLLVAVLHE